MYSVVTWDVDPAAANPAAIDAAVTAAIGARRTCRISESRCITRVQSGTDYVLLAETLQQIADTFVGEFNYALWALPARAAMRTNFTVEAECKKEVTDA